MFGKKTVKSLSIICHHGKKNQDCVTVYSKHLLVCHT